MLCCLQGSARDTTERDREYWAFQPLRPVSPPSLGKPNSRVLNPIDQFVLARLESNGLELAPPANREQLIRRVTSGLIGLPPSPEEVEAFADDPSPHAYEKLIDRLLASPHYGERWGRHWLDLARFAESDGFEHDAVRPSTWRYRDYVINSFNADKPYDRFVREQIAGDELFPDDPEALIATGFNLLGPDMVDSADQVQRGHNTLNDMTDTTGLVFLGQTLGCARCHNHKFEPFSQRDYYRLQAFFAPARYERELPVPTSVERAARETALARYNASTEIFRKQIEAIEAPDREQLQAEKLAKLSAEAQLAHRTPKENRTVEMQNQIQETAMFLQITEAELVGRLSAKANERRKALLAESGKVPKPASLPLAMALQDGNGATARTFILARGDYNNPGDEVQPGFPEILRKDSGAAASAPSAIPASRAALANWIASPDNPLTARVLVNRIWQHHFGRGIVPNPSDFGTHSEPPTHPNLLDWLAGEFIAHGWSIKHLHKLILLSATYQQSSQPSPEARTRDPENKLFSRQNRIRLEGETIRDCLLAISGQLNPKVGGPSVFPPIAAEITKSSKNWTASADRADHVRRSLYIFARRNLRFPFLEAFDAPDNNLSCPERGHSTTAPQSLTLLNSDEVMRAAKATAARVMAEAKSPVERIDRAFRLVLGRGPSAKESALTSEFLENCDTRLARTRTERSESQNPKPDRYSTRPASTAALEELCRALFNLNAFVYVD